MNDRSIEAARGPLIFFFNIYVSELPSEGELGMELHRM